MGLDQYAYARNGFPSQDCDFESEKDDTQIAYWRKHADLQGWMEILYHGKGGRREFNCVNVELTPKDLDRLEADMAASALPKTTGFFFGTSQPKDEEITRDFLATARAALSEGKSVYYTSWWIICLGIAISHISVSVSGLLSSV